MRVGRELLLLFRRNPARMALSRARRWRETESNQPLGQEIDIVTRALSADTRRNDMNGPGESVDRIDDAVALPDDAQATKAEKLFTKRLPLLLGVRLQSLRRVEQLLLNPPVADRSKHSERRLRPEDVVAPRRIQRVSPSRAATSSSVWTFPDSISRRLRRRASNVARSDTTSRVSTSVS